MKSLAVTYRPKTFKDLVGQNIVSKILEKQIEAQSFKNCYLFCGKSGSGKTSVARLFAHKINEYADAGGNLCSSEPIEIDAASHNGVDDIRLIIENANERSLDGKYKVFILDEAHAITSQGWQAFLKGIEEPPIYTIFIFCTTEPQKLPETILNRMQRFNFVPIEPKDIKDRLIYISKQEGFINYEEVCDFISKNVAGSMRSAISCLEQCADYSKTLSLDIAQGLIIGFSLEEIFKLTWAIKQNNIKDIISLFELIKSKGKDLAYFIDYYISFILDLLKYNIFKSTEILSIPQHLSTENNPVVQYTIQMFGSTDKEVSKYLNIILETLIKLKELTKADLSTADTLLAGFINLSNKLNMENLK